MEYHRTENGQIQADLARRLGIALRQYQEMSKKPNYDFSVTLSLSILQTLLASCIQLTKNMASNNSLKCFLSEPLGDSLPSCSESINFLKAVPCRPKTFLDFLEILRHSMSHPNPVNDSVEQPPTGFTSINDESGVLSRIRFVWAPNTHDQGWLMGFRSKDDADNLRLECIEEGYANADDLGIEEIRNFWYALNRKTGKRISRGVIVELSCNQINRLALALSTILAQPINQNWDGKTIQQIERVA